MKIELQSYEFLAKYKSTDNARVWSQTVTGAVAEAYAARGEMPIIITLLKDQKTWSVNFNLREIPPNVSI